MFFLIFILFFSLSTLSNSSLKDGVLFFNEGDYSQSRSILSHDNFADNPRAQLYLLASQGFEEQERPALLEQGLKAYLQEALDLPTSQDRVAAQLVRAFWNIYSETSVHDSHENLSDRPATSAAPFVAHMEESSMASINAFSQVIDVQPEGMDHVPTSFPASQRAVEILNVDDVVGYIENASHFPFPGLFDGTPSEAAGLAILKDLAHHQNIHGLYFLGSFCLTNDRELNSTLIEENKQAGLGCLTTAALRGHKESIQVFQEILGMDETKTWGANCDCWTCLGKPRGAHYLGCRGDSLGKWWHCGFGVCGFSTRWSLPNLCSNIRDISRTTKEHCAMTAGAVLILLQQLQASGVIEIPGNSQGASGWVGFTTTLLAYLSAQNKQKES